MPVLEWAGSSFARRILTRSTPGIASTSGWAPAAPPRAPASPTNGRWNVQGGPLVFAPFETGTDYWAADKQFMLNLRVSDLDGLLEQLTASGIEVTVKPEWDSPETGRFARIHDPEGNAIELWEAPR